MLSQPQTAAPPRALSEPVAHADHRRLHSINILLMCNSKPPLPPPRPLVETTGESGGLHVEGIHQVSIVLSSSAIVAIVVLIIAWCLLRGKKNCCKKNEADSSVRIQIPSAPQLLPAMIPPPQPTTAPPTDRELAQFLHLRQEQQRLQNQLDAMTPGRQLAIMQTPTT